MSIVSLLQTYQHVSVTIQVEQEETVYISMSRVHCLMCGRTIYKDNEGFDKHEGSSIMTYSPGPPKLLHQSREDSN